MFQIPTISTIRRRPGKASQMLISAITLVVFTFLDFLEIVFCTFYRFIDAMLEENNTQCYCESRGESLVGEDDQVSVTLYQRKNIFKDLGILKFGRNRERSLMVKKGRWSDCNCDTCTSWNQSEDQKLHVVLLQPSQGTHEDCSGKPAEDVIFLHGFLSSSLIWTKTVFPKFSETGTHNYRLVAVDLLGFGRSPKPGDSLYTLKDHIEMIEKSVITPFNFNSFHIVAHSMGCIVALGLAAKYPNSVKSITLVAPPYFPSSLKEDASLAALNRLAGRRLWPPLLFGISVMSWYEHLGRSVCFIVCRNHRRWEWILKLLTKRRDLHFMLIDITRHTHHSAWHTMHNVICGGAKLMDGYLETVKKSGMVITVIQGDKDQVVPLECSYNVKMKVPIAEVQIISNANHSTVIVGREDRFTRDLENIWSTAAEKHPHQRL